MRVPTTVLPVGEPGAHDHGVDLLDNALDDLGRDVGLELLEDLRQCADVVVGQELGAPRTRPEPASASARSAATRSRAASRSALRNSIESSADSICVRRRASSRSASER